MGTAFDVTIPEEAPSAPYSRPWKGSRVEATLLVPGALGSLSGEVDEAGGFRIPAVPAGPYWLTFSQDSTSEDKLYVLTEARSIELGTRRLGLGPGEIAQGPQTIRFTDLDPAQDGDLIEFYSTDRSFFAWWGPQPQGTTETTTPSGTSFPLRTDAAERLVAKQWRTERRGGLLIRRTVRASRVRAPEGPVMSLAIPLAASVPQQVTVGMDHAAFLDELRDLSEAPPSFSFSTWATPDPTDETLGGGTWLLSIDSFRTSASDPSTVRIDYVDPFPEAWARRFRLSYSGGRGYALPDSSRLQASCSSSVEATGLLGELGQGPVRPPLSLPRALEIDGRSALQELTEVSLSPWLSWQAPAHGAVSFYKVEITRLASKPDDATPGIVAGTLLTTRTRLQLPPGVLQPGAEYFLSLTAVSSDGAELSVAPLRALRRAGRGAAHLCSARFRTPSAKPLAGSAP